MGFAAFEIDDGKNLRFDEYSSREASRVFFLDFKIAATARVVMVLALGSAVLPSLQAQTGDQVLIVVNKQSGASKVIGDYYARKRGVPAANICSVDTDPAENISRDVFVDEVESPIAKFLTRRHLQEQILFIVTTMGVPLKVLGDGNGLMNTTAAVDSELTLLYQKLKGATPVVPGPALNPYFRQARDMPFRHPNFPMYLVTRLAAYNLEEVKGLIDKSLQARNVGKFVIDVRTEEATDGNHWLRAASQNLPPDRVVLDETAKVLKGVKDVIGYASWGSNDFDRKDRFLGFQWLPGAIMMEFVSTDARTFTRPPERWNIGAWKDRGAWFAGSPQTMIADYIHEGATGAAGHVDEPFLHLNPRPDFVLPAYYAGRTLAESFYLGMPALSWMNVVIGDPLCRLKP